jgi:glycerate kinase
LVVNLSIVIAPDSFKGSLPAAAVAEAMAAGWASVRPDDSLVLLPQADGGEGTVDAIEAAITGSVRRAAGPVTGPDGRTVAGEWLELPGGIAVVELAQSCGLPLMQQLLPLTASTRGLGEVLAHAVASGVDSIRIALGGSASTDGGSAALAALGLRLLDAAGAPLADGAAALTTLARLDSTHLLAPPPGGVTLLTDVDAPLLGPGGAAAIFGPQKGATPAEVLQLDAALARFAELLGGDASEPGAGAAGGTGYGFAAAWGGVVASGSAAIADLTGLPGALGRADVVITGEGRFDQQSLLGKVVGHTLDLAADRGTRTAVIAGQLSSTPPGWSASLSELAGSSAAAMADPERWLVEAAASAARALGG